DLASPQDLINFFNFIQAGNEQGVISAYHDIGDGGLLATVAEMQFTNRLAINLNLTDDNLLGQLFAEELGAVIQVLPEHVDAVMALAEEHNVADMLSLVGQTIETPVGGANQDKLTIITPSHQGENAVVFDRS